MRKTHEEHVTAGKLVEAAELQTGGAAQVRMHAVGELPGEALGGDLGYLDLRMGEEQAQQFAAGIAGGACDGCPDHRPAERR